MPLTKKGSNLEKIFEKEYGKTRGKNIFYAYENKHKHDFHKLGLLKKHGR